MANNHDLFDNVVAYQPGQQFTLYARGDASLGKMTLQMQHIIASMAGQPENRRKGTQPFRPRLHLMVWRHLQLHAVTEGPSEVVQRDGLRVKVHGALHVVRTQGGCS